MAKKSKEVTRTKLIVFIITFFLALLVPSNAVENVSSVSVILNGDGSLEIKSGIIKPYVAYAAFKNSMNETG